jgi:uncharacterized protein YndB with AHSA1/START domain
VFAFFTDPTRWAMWWGAGSTIDAQPGGRMVIRYPNGLEAHGEVLEVDAPRRLVFTYGYASGTPIAPGSSIVTIRLVAEGDSTRLHLAHDFAEAKHRDEHVHGWRYQLSLFGNVVADAVYAHAAESVDAWFDAWSDPDGERRAATLARIASAAVRFQDRFSAIEGVEDLQSHLAAAQRFMPGLRMAREGDVRHCQGTVLAEWVARSTDGTERARGTNVFTFANRRIDSVVGFWSPAASRQ